MLVRAEVVDPELLRPGLLLSGLAVEEEHVGLHALRVEDAGGQAEQRVDVGLLEERATNRLPSAAFEEDVVGHDHGGAAVLLEDREDVLEEVELLVRGRGPEVVAVDHQRFLRGVALLVHDGDAALLAEGRIGQHDVVLAVLAREGVLRSDGQVRGACIGTDAVEQQVHRAEARDAVDQLDAEERAVVELLLLGAVEVGALREVIVGCEQEPAGAAGWIADGLARLRRHRLDNGGDERTRREVLAGAALHIGRVLFQEALVGVALHIGAEGGPLLLVDEVDDEPAEFGGVLDLVLRLAEDDAQHARLLAQLLQGVAVLDLEVVAVALEQHRPRKAPRDRRGLVVRWPRLLVGHLEEEQKGELLDVVAVRQAVIPQDVAVVPELLDESGGGHGAKVGWRALEREQKRAVL